MFLPLPFLKLIDLAFAHLMALSVPVYHRTGTAYALAAAHMEIIAAHPLAFRKGIAISLWKGLRHGI